MKDYLIKAFFVFSGAAIAFSIMTLARSCEPVQKVQQTLHSSDTVYVLADTSTKHIEQINSEIHHYQTDSIIYVPKLNKSELEKVLNDYFAKYFYSDTINKDSVQVVINDTLTKNSIAHRDVFLKNLRANKIITNNYTQPEDPHNKVFIGLFADYQYRISGGFSLSLLDKNDRLITANYDPFYKDYRLSYSGKIHF